MFKISQSETYVWPVKVEFPKDGGTFDVQTFDGMFKRLPQSRIKEINAEIAEGKLGDLQLASEVLVGWKGVQDQDGHEMPFSESARDRLLDVALVAAAISKAFYDSLRGSNRKN